MKELRLKSTKYILVSAGAVLAVLLFTAGSPGDQGRHKLGGSWIGTGGGMVWNALQAPLDPDAQTASLRVINISYGSDWAGLMAMFGADNGTEGVGELHMTGRNCAYGGFISYFTKGNPPVICAIVEFKGTTLFPTLDSEIVTGVIEVYQGAASALPNVPNADVDGDGFPDPGTTPVLAIPVDNMTAKRVQFPGR